MFVAVGTQPNTEFLAGALPLDAGGYIAASETGETPIPGVFAAGDVRRKPFAKWSRRCPMVQSVRSRLQTMSQSDKILRFDNGPALV